MIRRALAALLLGVCLAAPAVAELDLANARRMQLDNGLTVLLLPDRAFPVVSVQMLYRAGARDEAPGRTGLAHFVEHMAFRGSRNFPGTGLVDAIYAVGGEWHGYTYLDQTTYFATVPEEHLDLLLRIEADRLARLEIKPDDIAAERGAVLAEMQGYENDPSAVLHDAVVAQAFLAHPYRNNTIGWPEDVAAIEHADVVRFYKAHYRAANAVLAIVGNFPVSKTRARIRELFADLPALPATPPPVTVEPPQSGARHIVLAQPAERDHFQFVWPAPAANSSDYAPFLLLQELLGGIDGANFLHNEWGVPVRTGSVLDGIGDDLRTFMMPTAQPYVFAIKGSVAAGADRDAFEARILAAIAALQDAELAPARLERAKARVKQELLLDIQTTEDAAHQLAFFAGLEALDTLLELPARIDAVSADDVRHAAREYLAPARRTMGWLVDGPRAQLPAATAPRNVTREPPQRVTRRAAPLPRTAVLDSGIPVILQPSPLTATAHVSVVVPGGLQSPSLTRGHPISGHAAVEATVATGGLTDAIRDAAAALATVQPAGNEIHPASDPYRRTEQLFEALMPSRPGGRPLLIAVTGQFDEAATLAELDRQLGELRLPATSPGAPPRVLPAVVREHTGWPVAQARIAYAVNAPPPGTRAADAWQALLYILSHDYGGRLGRAAISEQGLVYYIDARYRSNGERSLLTLSAGVDPAKLDAMEALLRAELARLTTEPPTVRELAEAVSHRIGRAVSAAQSNHELADRLARQWLWYGKPVAPDELRRRLSRLSIADLEAALPAFTAGTIITVTE